MLWLAKWLQMVGSADGGVTSEHDVKQLFEKHKGSTRDLLEALKNQIRYIKAVHQIEGIEYKLFHFSSKGKECTVKTIYFHWSLQSTKISHLPVPPKKQPKTEEQTRKERNELKQRYLCKNSSPSKRPRTIGPFPSDKLIGHRIRHKFFLKKRHHTYKGIVLRRALDKFGQWRGAR